MRRIYSVVILLLILILFSVQVVRASSNYVLPYPSTMPGGISYKLHVLFEQFQKYWYFGDFGSFSYNLKESDKYLVEAKTLFEYKQYLLGARALKKSGEYFRNIRPALVEAQKNGKNIQDKQDILEQASQKHIETLMKMKAELPSKETWNPEHGEPTFIPIQQLLESSARIRKQ